ncbi:MAG: alpha-2-macroglobulin family protein [Vicingaceae bacterium]
MNKYLLTLIFISSLFLSSCDNQKKTLQKQANKEVSYASYEGDWKEIQKLERQGLAKSIIQKVDAVLERALAEGNANQIFKALAYRSKYVHEVEEESSFKIIQNFEDKIESTDLPTQALLQSATAELYVQYYQNNRWQFKQRSNTESYEPKDLKSWSLDQIMQKALHYHLAALEAEEALLSYPISTFNEILQQHSNNMEGHYYAEAKRPSLYEFLAARSVAFLETQYQQQSVSSTLLPLDNKQLFDPFEYFVKLPLEHSDSLSPEWNTLKLYQTILKNCEAARHEQAFLDFNLMRLNYVLQISKAKNKESHYLGALNELEKSQSWNEENLAEIKLAQAQFLYRQGNQYNWKDSSSHKHQWDLKSATEIAKKYKSQDHYAGKRLATLLRRVQQAHLQILMENVYTPEKPVLFYLAYRNLDSLKFSLYKVAENFNLGEVRDFKGQLAKVKKEKQIRTWATKVQSLKDYQVHSTELYTENLAIGNYYLVTELPDQQAAAITSFEVSNLGFLSQQDRENGEVSFLVRDRESGKALSGAELRVSQKVYDPQSRKVEPKLLETLKTNQNGEASFKKTTNGGFSVAVSLNGDTLSNEPSFYNHRNRQTDHPKMKAFHYTDRAIYRPGQSVYVKGIWIAEKSQSMEPANNQTVSLSLYDQNGQKIHTVQSKTNDYGSYEAQFILPKGKLNGRFRIQDQHGSKYIQVEEYKRPSFEIALKPIEKQYKIGEEVELKGQVKSYSGVELSGLNLRYRVYRKPTYPYWPFYSSFFHPSQSQEIAFGNLKSDQNGNFVINFNALGDSDLKPKWQAVYHYTVDIEASRLSGETQGIQETIRIGEQALFLSSNLSQWNELEAVKNLIIEAKNIQGKKIQAKAELVLKKLKTPKDVPLESYWGQVDLASLSEKEYQNLFPRRSPKKSDELAQLEIANTVLSGRISCNQKVDLIGDLAEGAYEVSVKSTDRFGKKVEFSQRFVMFNPKKQASPFPTFFKAKAITPRVEAGETAEILISSGLRNLEILYEIEFEGQIIHKEWLKLSANQKIIRYPIKTDQQGKLYFHFIGMHSNRIIKEQIGVEVPYSSKKLNLRLHTFRNLVEPGSKEKWSAEVQNNKEDGVQAEVLASLYDQSLDAFAKDPWRLNLYQAEPSRLSWMSYDFTVVGSRFQFFQGIRFQDAYLTYPQLNWFGLHMGYSGYRGQPMMMADKARDDGVMLESASQVSNTSAKSGDTKNDEEKESVQIRKSFAETAFFFPQMKSDKNGKLSFEFQMPEALTKWRLRLLAHDKNLAVAYLDTTVISQKSLMVQANAPRYFRAGDKMQFKAAVQNPSSEAQEVNVSLRFYNLTTGKPIEIFTQNAADQQLYLQANENKALSWEIKIPQELAAIRYEIIARSEQHSDGETKSLAVLNNRTLVTETLPLTLREAGNYQFTFEKFLDNKSSSLQHKSFTFDYTANPNWYVVQALPYLSQADEENAEQVFHQLFANAVAQKIVTENPRIEAIFKQWKQLNPETFLSKLEQNQELKSVILEETPWLQEAKSEAEQKHRIALLFSVNQMQQHFDREVRLLADLQLSNGGWPWIKGMRDNRYITQLILEGFGKLKKMGIHTAENQAVRTMLERGLQYVDERLAEDYERLTKNQADFSKNHLGNSQIQALYLRSFFPETPFQKGKKAHQFYLNQAEEYWLNRPLSTQAMQAIALHRLKPQSQIPSSILSSIRDRSIEDPKQGMYWKSNQRGYYWYQSPIETQAMLIEAFSEISISSKLIKEMQVWLVNQKRTQNWVNTKATAAACYAILMQGESTLKESPLPQIRLGNQKLQAAPLISGLGYIKKTWQQEEVDKKMGNISLVKPNDQLAFGAAYWQYTEEFDKISAAENDELNIEKTLFKEVFTEGGKKIIPIDKAEIQVGDKVVVRLRMQSKLDLEFVHLKDQGAACFEPVNVISNYQYQDGLAYYQSSKDASTNFYFDRLPKGTYVFEFSMRINQEGEFSSGLSQLQCYYAPEYSSHSKGRMLLVKPKLD